MRCQFCGWDNAQGKETCEKCGKPLKSSDNNNSRLTVQRNFAPQSYGKEDSAKSFNPRETINEASINKDNILCPECGYPLEAGTCANCGYPNNTVEKTQPEIANVRKTIRPNRKEENVKSKTFSLLPISETTGEMEGERLIFEGECVSLNRENIDPKNNTITSLEQAVVSVENGEWVIEDKSEYKTTFVQAARKIVLKDGDLVLLGNQLFRFEK